MIICENYFPSLKYFEKTNISYEDRSSRIYTHHIYRKIPCQMFNYFNDISVHRYKIKDKNEKNFYQIHWNFHRTVFFQLSEDSS